jgi:hypothetical protein
MDDICHVIVPYHVLNDYCLKQLVHNDFKAINRFLILWLEY